VVPWRLIRTIIAAELRSQELTRVAAYPQGPLRKLKADENDIFNGKPGDYVVNQVTDGLPAFSEAPETRNERALAVYNRVQNKLTGACHDRCRSCFLMPIWTPGRDFNPDVPLTVPMQVEKLILQATSLENLCQCFSGWCAFW